MKNRLFKKAAESGRKKVAHALIYQGGEMSQEI